jgi:3-deoxy-alpha-D-manno-octulosonate 8-oxidase
MKLSKNVSQYVFGVGSIQTLSALLQKRRTDGPSVHVVYVIDQYFANRRIPALDLDDGRDTLIWVDTKTEPTTTDIDEHVATIREAYGSVVPCAVVGIGGGCALDTAKAISNLLTNEGRAADYQGWDLLRRPGAFKVGIPTLSGTGAEASRTCVMTNKEKNLKLGMNSEFSLFDHLILDPTFSKTAPRDQYFYTAMDTYIHCVESLNGKFRHTLADSFSREAIQLCREIFMSDDMMSDLNREKLMAASYLGGSSIANTFVGVVHPLSAGLGTVLGLHHCVANCIVMNAMDHFYPGETKEFRLFVVNQHAKIPLNVCQGLSESQFDSLYESAIVHEKPLRNALGDGFRDILSPALVRKLYESM